MNREKIREVLQVCIEDYLGWNDTEYLSPCEAEVALEGVYDRAIEAIEAEFRRCDPLQEDDPPPPAEKEEP